MKLGNMISNDDRAKLKKLQLDKMREELLVKAKKRLAELAEGDILNVPENLQPRFSNDSVSIPMGYGLNYRFTAR